MASLTPASRSSSAFRRADPLPAAAAVLGTLLALAPPALSWPPGTRVAALALVLGVAPGLLVARRAAADWSGVERGALALALAPFLTAAPAALLVLAGLRLVTAARGVALAVAVLSARAAWRPAPDPARPPAPRV
ncbi:MAG TPA: hypothetical protein VI792_03330, partial [Candidatus Eisenbacteria bacterium]